jgi:hypothetical protein
MNDSDNFEPEDEELDALIEESACELLPLQETMLPYQAHIGAMLSVNGRIIEVVMVRPSTITPLDIEMYGDHLREHEGSIGTVITYIESDHGPAGPTPDCRPAGPTSPGAPPSSPGAPPSSLGAPPSSPGAPPSSPGAPPSSLGAPPSSPGAPPSSSGVVDDADGRDVALRDPPEWGVLECQERHIDPVASREEAEQLVAAYNQASRGSGIRYALRFLVVRSRRIPRPEHLQDLGGPYWEVMPSPSPQLPSEPSPEPDDVLWGVMDPNGHVSPAASREDAEKFVRDFDEINHALAAQWTCYEGFRLKVVWMKTSDGCDWTVHSLPPDAASPA